MTDYEKTLDKEQKLRDLTSKFLNDFAELSGEKNKNFTLNCMLPDILGDVFPMRNEDQQYSILLGMSEFDTGITKKWFNNRIQGFSKIIEDRIKPENLIDQEDFCVENVIEERYKYKGFDCRGKKFKLVEKKNKKITFDVSNSRSGFKGKVELLYVDGINSKFEKVDQLDKMIFRVDGKCVMSINVSYDIETDTRTEKGQIHHFKHISDINSFYITLICE